MLDVARKILDIVAPAGDFIHSDAFDILMTDMESGFVVGRPAFVESAYCDHLAFSSPGTDCQIWIEKGDRPLPSRIVIISRDILNAPQFAIHIREWDLAPDMSQVEFSFANMNIQRQSSL